MAGEIFSRPVAPPSGEEEGAGEALGPEGMEVDGGSQAPVLGAGANAITCCCWLTSHNIDGKACRPCCMR